MCMSALHWTRIPWRRTGFSGQLLVWWKLPDGALPHCFQDQCDCADRAADHVRACHECMVVAMSGEVGGRKRGVSLWRGGELDAHEKVAATCIQVK